VAYFFVFIMSPHKDTPPAKNISVYKLIGMVLTEGDVIHGDLFIDIRIILRIM
jgi:hypothetical protein